MKQLQVLVSKCKELQECVGLTASLAPFPVLPVGQVTVTKKQKKNGKQQKSDNRDIH